MCPAGSVACDVRADLGLYIGVDRRKLGSNEMDLGLDRDLSGRSIGRATAPG